ncbi:MAG: cupin protein [Conexibacter sp.]|jgi:AraC family transcriptional activator of pobA|nr:cupin protein [Conexibacter sp.]
MSRPSPHRAAPERRPDGRLVVDRLGDDVDAQVVVLDDARVGEGPIREPHRHDYHELFWLRDGAGQHLIDGEELAVVPRTVTVIGRGQVHQFRHASGLRGGLLRFTDAALAGGAERIAAGWLLTGRGGRAIAVPDGEGARLDGLLAVLRAETQRPADPFSADVVRHLISTLLLWLERWYDASRTERRDADDAEVQLHRRFTALLERDFARHHDAGHYADALAVPGPALSRALVALTGRATKELITERVMLEAVRLLRFTDLAVGEVAFRVGFADQLYFSRAFKRSVGRAPQAYRDAARG